MNKRTPLRLVPGLEWVVLAAVFVLPAAGFAVTLWTGWDRAAEVSFDAHRHGALLVRTLGLSIAAAIVAVLLALPVTFALTRRAGRGWSTTVLVAALSTLLCPPMVLVFGWQRLAILRSAPSLLAVGVWAMWAWPVAGVILASFWLRRGQAVYEAMLLEARADRAFLYSVTRSLRSACLCAALILVAVFLNEYSVPHACGLTVYATELLAVATSSSVSWDLLVASAPVVGIMLLLGVLAWRADKGVPVDVRRLGHPAAAKATGWRAGAVSCCLFAAWVMPLAALSDRADLVQQTEMTFRAYGSDLLATVGVSGVAGALSVPVAWSVLRRGRLGRVVLVTALVAGLVPGGVVGEAFVAGYNHAPLAAIADHWPVIALAHCARFAWIPALAAATASRGLGTLREQATLDGANAAERFWCVDRPLASPILRAAAVCMVTVACGDAVVVALLRVPDYSPLSLLVIEKFHRFEEGIVAVLSMQMAAVSGLASLAVLFASRWLRTWGRSGLYSTRRL